MRFAAWIKRFVGAVLATAIFAAPSYAETLEQLSQELQKLSRQFEACGADMDCVTKLTERINALSEQMQALMPQAMPGPAPAAPAPAVAAGPLPTIDGLVAQFLACEDGTQCYMAVFNGAMAALHQHCRSDTVCLGVGQVDIAIAHALANIERDGKGADQPAPPIKGAVPARSAALLMDWRGKLDPALPRKIRAEVEAYANRFPARPAQGAPPIQLIQRGGEAELKPASRDWAFALKGAIFFQIGLADKARARYLDLAMWCFVRAAELTEEAEHLSNLGFILNLIRKYDQARDVLAKARDTDPNHPDVRANMAFSLQRLGQPEAAAREAGAALALNLAAEARSLTGEALGDGVTAAPPGDWGLAYFRLVRDHTPSWVALERQYGAEVAAPLDRAFNVDGQVVPPDSPRGIRNRRDRANQAALDRCVAAIPPPPSPCPFGSAIAHPSCSGGLSAGDIKVHQLRYQKETCECHLAFAKADVKHHKTFVFEQIGLAKRFNGRWTPRIRQAAGDWRQRILTLNALYADADPRQGTFAFPWPDQFYKLLERHYQDLNWFAKDWRADVDEEFRMRFANWQSWKQKCRQAALELEAYEKDYFALRPLKCEQAWGKTEVINLGIIKLSLFFPEGRAGEFAGKIDLDIPLPFDTGLKAEAWESTHGAEGRKVEGSIGPVSGNVWQHSNGDWGAGADFNVLALKGGPGAFGGRAIGNATNRKIGAKATNWGEFLSKHVVKTDLKGEVGYNSASGTGTGWSAKIDAIGLTRTYGPPPAWARLRHKSPGKGKGPGSGRKKYIDGIPVAPGC